MKKFMVILALLLFVSTVVAEQKNAFSAASVKKTDGIPSLVSGLDIPVKTDADSLKKFVKNDFYKAFNIGRDVEPQLLRAVNIDGSAYYKFVPFYKGIKVEGIYTVVTVRDGKVDRISNGLSDIDIDVTRMIPADKALKSAMAVRKMKIMPKNYTVEKIITRHFGRFIPAYKIRFSPATLADSRDHIVDALTGKVIKSSHSTFFADGGDKADSDASDGGDTTPAPADSGDTGSEQTVWECKGNETDTAKIWQFNPVITPKLEEVKLPWVASTDDSELTPELLGSLITEKDAKGIRKIKAYNCPDDGYKINIDPAALGFGEAASQFGIEEINVHACHPMPLANKCEKGSFVYDDCDGGHEFSQDSLTPEKIDRCAEISMYYHASKIYNYIRSIYSDIDSKDEFYLQNNNKKKPLNVISNFTIPEINMTSMEDMMALIQGNNELAPFDNAFFLQDNELISMLLKDVSGDLLVFGQGTKADMGYDGDVVYHEFGHATLYTAGITGLEYTDKYGMTVEPGALHEGMADTFAFIMTDNTCTGEYASKGFAEIGAGSSMDKEGDVYCMRSALNKNKVFENFVGEVHFDGQPLLASNWDIYQLVKGDDKDTQKHRDNLAKLFLKTLYAIGDADASFKLWAETLMAEVEKDDNFKGKAKEIRKILEDRNFFEEVRARSLNKEIKDKMYVPAGGVVSSEDEEDEDNPMAGLMGEGGGVLIDDDGEEVRIGPAYIQYYFDVPENNKKTALKISAKIAADSSSDMLGGLIGNAGGTPKMEVYYRKGAPVEYSATDSGAAKVARDGKVSGTAKKGWIVPEAEAGARYYIQFVNVSSSAGTLSSISVESSDAAAEEGGDEEGGDEVAEEDKDASPDDDMTYGDDETQEDENKKKSGGCSLVF